MSKVNFITTNAVDTILAVPRPMDPPEPNYLEKEDYGKVPKYLHQVRAKTRGNYVGIVRRYVALESGGGGVLICYLP